MLYSNVDAFGENLETSENYIIVSNRKNDTDASNSGRAYLYDIHTGNLLFSFANPSPSADDEFGITSAVSEQYVVVGAWLEDGAGTNRGAAYVYSTKSGDLLHTLDGGSLDDNDAFGMAVAVHGDYIAVSSYGDDTGAADAGIVNVYNAHTGNLLYTVANPTPSVGDILGWWAIEL